MSQTPSPNPSKSRPRVAAAAPPDISDIADLQTDPRNARKRSERSSWLLHDSLQRYGAARSIVIDEAGRIIAGHGTVEAAGMVGINRVQVVDADGETIIAVRRSDLTEEQKQALAIADNRTADLAEWDAIALADLAQDVDLAQFFHPEELEALVKALPPMEDAPRIADKGPGQEVLCTCPSCGHEFVQTKGKGASRGKGK
jgi:hypothetical protein